MASVCVAVRLRPLDEREKKLFSKTVVEIKENTVTIHKPVGQSTRGDEVKTFSFDFTYDSSGPQSVIASQKKIYNDLGSGVITAACEGFNTCIFAYGQTGSGKSYTMMGHNKGDKGLIPRICENLFEEISEKSLRGVSFHTEVSYLEIYNERVQDLLRKRATSPDKKCLKVREHPKEGPYVQNLTSHLVQSYSDVEELILLGNANRTTASTNMNDTSSRSHAIFTIRFTRAWFEDELPCETVSKIHLVDLAGCERADATRATGARLKEGANINKSLVTLGCVISTLVLFQNIVTTKKKQQIFIPYRDSVLTWLLKDSLGGNSKTTMIATISPADVNYGETLSTLNYASRAKNIVNTPTVNEDNSVKVIRGLQAEVTRLRKLLEDASQVPKGKTSSCVEVEEKLHENEAKVAALTREWASKWRETHNILQEETVALRKEGSGVVLDCQLPHLIGIEEDQLGSGIILYYIKEGQTTIGSNEALCGQHILLHGPGLLGEHCVLKNQNGVVTLIPQDGALCLLNGSVVTAPCQLTQGSIIQLGKGAMYRFNHPAEAALLRKKQQSGLLSAISLSLTDMSKSAEGLSKVMLQKPGLVSVTVETSTSTERTITAIPVQSPVPHSTWESDGKALVGGVCTWDVPDQEGDWCHKSGPELVSERPQRRPRSGAEDAASGEEVWSGDASLHQMSVPGRGDGCGMRPGGNANEIQEVTADCFERRPDSDGNSLSSVSHLQSTIPQTNSHSQFDKTPHSQDVVSCSSKESGDQSICREMDEAGDIRAKPSAALGLGSLVNTMSWIVQGASRRILNSSMLQHILEQSLHPYRVSWSSHMISLLRNSKVLSVAKDSRVISLVKDSYITSMLSDIHVFSFVKDLPLVQHIQLEIYQHRQNSTNVHNCPVDNVNKSLKDVEYANFCIKDVSRGLQRDQGTDEVKAEERIETCNKFEVNQTLAIMTSPVWHNDVKIVCQVLVTFPDSMTKLQKSLSELGASIQSALPISPFTSQKVVAIFWLMASKSTEPEAHPALVVLVETGLYTLIEKTGSLQVFHHLPLVLLKEVQMGFAGHSLCLMGSTEECVLGLYTYSQKISKELCGSVLGVMCPNDTRVTLHPLLNGDLIDMSLKWQAVVPDLLLDAGLRVSSHFQKSLADLVYLLHCNTNQEQGCLGEVHLLLYCSVGMCLSAHSNVLGQLFVTDTHLGLVQEDIVFHPSVSAEKCRLQFHNFSVRPLSDVRCVVVHDVDECGTVTVDVILVNVKARGHPESEASSQVWKLTLSCSAEAARLINHLSNV